MSPVFYRETDSFIPAHDIAGLMGLGGLLKPQEKPATKFRALESQIQHWVVMVEDIKDIQVMHGKNF